MAEIPEKPGDSVDDPTVGELQRRLDRLNDAFYDLSTSPSSLGGLAKAIKTLEDDIAKRLGTGAATKDDLDERRRARAARRAGSDSDASASRRGQPRRSGRGS